MGYLLPGGALLPIRYVAAVLAVAGIKWSLSGLKAITRHGIFAPLMAFLATGCTGLAMALVEGPSAYDILIVVAESLVAGGFAYFAAVAMQVIGVEREKSALTPQEQSSVMAVAAVILMAVAGIQFSGISPGRILSVLVILLMARCGKEQGGSIAGIVLGLCMAMAQPGAFVFGGGLFLRRADGGHLQPIRPVRLGGGLCGGQYHCGGNGGNRCDGDHRGIRGGGGQHHLCGAAPGAGQEDQRLFLPGQGSAGGGGAAALRW